MVTWESIYLAFNLVIASLLVVVTLLLAKYTKLLYKATSDQGDHIKKQTDIMGEQISFLDKQSKIMGDEANAMEEDRRYRMLVEKYRRLRDEMDKLVAPLFVHASAYTDEKPGHFTGFEVGEIEKLRGEYKGRSEFWNDILKNSHLSQSEDLSEYLRRHYESNFQLACSKNGIDEQRVKDNAHDLVEKIKDRYSQLKAELDSLEIELGIRKP